MLILIIMLNMKILDEEDSEKVFYLQINVPRLTSQEILKLTRSSEKKRDKNFSPLIEDGIKDTDRSSKIKSKVVPDKIKRSSTTKKRHLSCVENFNSEASEGSESDDIFVYRRKHRNKKLKSDTKKIDNCHSNRSKKWKKVLQDCEPVRKSSRQYDLMASDSDKIFISLCKTEKVNEVSTALESGSENGKKIKEKVRSSEVNRWEPVLKLKCNTDGNLESRDESKYEGRLTPEEKEISCIQTKFEENAEWRLNNSAFEERVCEQISVAATTKYMPSKSTCSELQISETCDVKQQISETSDDKQQISNMESPSLNKSIFKECFVILERISIPQVSTMQTQNDGDTLGKSSSSFVPETLLNTNEAPSENLVSVREKSPIFCFLDISSVRSVTSTFNGDRCEKSPRKSLSSKKSILPEQNQNINSMSSSRRNEPDVPIPYVNTISEAVNICKEFQIILRKVDEEPVIWNELKSKTTVNLTTLCGTETNNIANLSVCEKIAAEDVKNVSQLSSNVSLVKARDTNLKDVSNLPSIATPKPTSRPFDSKNVPPVKDKPASCNKLSAGMQESMSAVIVNEKFDLYSRISDESTLVSELKPTKKKHKFNASTENSKCTGDSTMDASTLHKNITFSSVSRTDKSEDTRLRADEANLSKNKKVSDVKLTKLDTSTHDVTHKPIERSVEPKIIPKANQSAHRSQSELGLQTPQTNTSLPSRCKSDFILNNSSTPNAKFGVSNTSKKESTVRVSNKTSSSDQSKSSVKMHKVHASTKRTEIVDTSPKNANATLKPKNNSNEHKRPSSAVNKSVLCDQPKEDDRLRKASTLTDTRRNCDSKPSEHDCTSNNLVDQFAARSQTKPHKIDSTPNDLPPLCINDATKLSGGSDKSTKSNTVRSTLNKPATCSKPTLFSKWRDIDIFSEYDANKRGNSKNTPALSNNKAKKLTVCSNELNKLRKECTSRTLNKSIIRSKQKLCTKPGEINFSSKCGTIENHRPNDLPSVSISDVADLTITSSDTDELDESITEYTSRILNASVTCSKQKPDTEWREIDMFAKCGTNENCSSKDASPSSVDTVAEISTECEESNESNSKLNKPKLVTECGEIEKCRAFESHNPDNMTLPKSASCNKRKRSTESEEINLLSKTGTISDYIQEGYVVSHPSAQYTPHHKSKSNAETRERNTSTKSAVIKERNPICISPEPDPKRIMLEIRPAPVHKPEPHAELRETSTALNTTETIDSGPKDKLVSPSDNSLELSGESTELENSSNKYTTNSESEPNSSTGNDSVLLFDDSDRDSDTSCELNNAILLSSKDAYSQSSAASIDECAEDVIGRINDADTEESQPDCVSGDSSNESFTCTAAPPMVVAPPAPRTLVGRIRVKTATELDCRICFIDDVKHYNDELFSHLSNAEKTNLVREKDFNLYKLVQSKFKYKSENEMNITSILDDISNPRDIRSCGHNLFTHVRQSMPENWRLAKTKDGPTVVVSLPNTNTREAAQPPPRFGARAAIRITQPYQLPKRTQSNFLTNCRATTTWMNRAWNVNANRAVPPVRQPPYYTSSAWNQGYRNAGPVNVLGTYESLYFNPRRNQTDPRARYY